MRPKRRDGFTLLEVLIAFAIVGIALAVLIHGVGFGADAARQAGRYEEAVSRARSHLAGIGSDIDRLAGSRNGEDGGGYHWQLDVQPFRAPNHRADATPVPQLYRVTVTISWHDGDKRRQLALTSERLGRMPP